MSKRSKDLPPAITISPLLSHNSISSLHQTPSLRPSPIVTMSSTAPIYSTPGHPDHIDFRDRYAAAFLPEGYWVLEPAGPTHPEANLKKPKYPLPTPGSYPRDLQGDLCALRGWHHFEAGRLYCEQPLKERMARDRIQFYRSQYCLLQEWLILHDFYQASAAAMTIAIGDKQLTAGKGRRRITLPTEINKTIESYFLPSIKTKPDLIQSLHYFMGTLKYDRSDNRLITTLLIEDISRRQSRRDKKFVIYTESRGTHESGLSWRPDPDDLDPLALPWGFSDNLGPPSGECDCGDCHQCHHDMLPEDHASEDCPYCQWLQVPENMPRVEIDL